uniref:Uncharacterized protein n=1 Tax=Parastrongyloides trichosuri TaxID=131310 RepID=A0A0N4Z3C3_PARTI
MVFTCSQKASTQIVDSSITDAQLPVNSIAEIKKDQNAGWLRQGEKVIKFASVKPFEETLSLNTTPSNSLDSDEGRHYEFPEVHEDNEGNNRNHIQNGNVPFHQNSNDYHHVNQQYIHNGPRLFNPLPGIQVIQQQPPFPQPHVVPGHLNHPINTFPYPIPPVANLPFPPFVGFPCYLPTVVDYAVTRRVINPPYNPVFFGNQQISQEFPHPHQQTHPQGQYNNNMQFNNYPSQMQHQQSNNTRENENVLVANERIDIPEGASSSNENHLSNGNPGPSNRGEIVNRNDSIDGRGQDAVSNAFPSINSSQSNVPNHDNEN